MLDAREEADIVALGEQHQVSIRFGGEALDHGPDQVEIRLKRRQIGHVAELVQTLLRMLHEYPVQAADHAFNVQVENDVPAETAVRASEHAAVNNVELKRGLAMPPMGSCFVPPVVEPGQAALVKRGENKSGIVAKIVFAMPPFSDVENALHVARPKIAHVAALHVRQDSLQAALAWRTGMDVRVYVNDLCWYFHDILSLPAANAPTLSDNVIELTFEVRTPELMWLLQGSNAIKLNQCE